MNRFLDLFLGHLEAFDHNRVDLALWLGQTALHTPGSGPGDFQVDHLARCAADDIVAFPEGPGTFAFTRGGESYWEIGIAGFSGSMLIGVT